MRRIIKASMEDRSSMERFQFSLRCAVCGSLWESQGCSRRAEESA